MTQRLTSAALTWIVIAFMSGCTNSVEGPAGAAHGELGAGAEHHSPAVNKQLAELRQVTAKYHDPAEAEADGYHNEGVCIDAALLGAPPELGAMGVHFVNGELIDDTFDPLEPEVLVYAPREDGELHLVAVEYLTTGDEPPPFAGEVHFHPFQPPFADFELHAWVWQGNPNGTFAEFNPNVTCPET